MLKRLYIHNFRCLENFELAPGGMRNVLLLGRNGSGKSTVALALELLQKIARGTNRVGALLQLRDFAAGRTQVPIRIEIEADIQGLVFLYSISFELPAGFREVRVSDERLIVNGSPVYTRELAQVRLARTGHAVEAAFRIDWHLVALPIVQESNSDDPLFLLKRWLASILILNPVPSGMRGDSELDVSDQFLPAKHIDSVGKWFSGMVAESPSVYSQVSDYLSQVMPDFSAITNPSIGKDSRQLIFHFKDGSRELKLALEDMSDGEKCFVVFALAIATNLAVGPILCFWDEPDSYLAPDEVGHAVLALRKAFREKGQLFVTSHNAEAVRRFSQTDTLYLHRKSRLEPTLVTSIEVMRDNGAFQGSFVDALIRGDLSQ